MRQGWLDSLFIPGFESWADQSLQVSKMGRMTVCYTVWHNAMCAVQLCGLRYAIFFENDSFHFSIILTVEGILVPVIHILIFKVNQPFVFVAVWYVGGDEFSQINWHKNAIGSDIQPTSMDLSGQCYDRITHTANMWHTDKIVSWQNMFVTRYFLSRSRLRWIIDTTLQSYQEFCKSWSEVNLDNILQSRYRSDYFEIDTLFNA